MPLSEELTYPLRTPSKGNSQKKMVALALFNGVVEDLQCQGLQELMLVPERLRSMTHFPHLRITC